MAKVLIVYFSRTGITEKMANYVAEGVRFSGAELGSFNALEAKLKSDDPEITKACQDYGKAVASLI